MNYGKKGIRAKQHALNSKAIKLERKFLLTLLMVVIVAFAGLAICGVSAGIGAFKGILACTPKIRLNDVVASGQATIVYDCEGNEIDQYVSSNSNRLRVESMEELPDYLGKAFRHRGRTFLPAPRHRLQGNGSCRLAIPENPW